ncbi:Hypothetical protein FKW44_003692, partial [Caligus rogercresseyi]
KMSKPVHPLFRYFLYARTRLAKCSLLRIYLPNNDNMVLRNAFTIWSKCSDYPGASTNHRAST